MTAYLDAAEPVVSDMAIHEMDSLERRLGWTVPARPETAGMLTRQLVAGLTALGAAVTTSIAWLGWRVSHLGLHPIELAFFVAEIVSVVTGIVVGLGLASSSWSPSSTIAPVADRRESFRFAFAVTDACGRPRPTDLRSDTARSWRAVWGGDTDLSALATAAVLCDGPRRLLLIVSLTLALLFGVAPVGVPPIWAVVCAVAALGAMSWAHVLLSAGRIRIGDRVRWSSAALGEVCSGTDCAGVAPRRWVGTVAAVVTLNLAIGLRGMSDRWTHGLAAMAPDGRLVTLLLAEMIVLGGLYTLRTTNAPQLDNAHLVSRRIEERTARQSAVGATVALGLIGLAAGVLPGGLDTSDKQPLPVEHVSDQYSSQDPDRSSGRIDRVEAGRLPIDSRTAGG